MLKQGQIVALAPTQELLGRFGGIRLRVRWSGAPLPAVLRDRVIGQEAAPNDLTLTLQAWSEAEAVLAQFRLAGCQIEDLKVVDTDLEEVFLHLMQTPTECAGQEGRA
jgi:ABC-2 type transport system ATP-binding protein